MSTRMTLIISLTLIVIATLAGLLLWNQLPEQMASHWNVNDQVDDTMPKFWGVFLMPLVTTGMFREAFNLFIVLIIAFMLYIHGLTLAWSIGYQNFKMSAAMLPFMGVLFIAIGFMMKKAKRNFFIGIRTPWTLSSDYVWDETHRIGATLFMASGLLTIIGSLFGGMISFWMLFIPLIGSTIFLLVYSYVLYQRETKS
jgi:uncharacterized membrane protein